MSILDRYLVKSLAQAALLVMAVLLLLGALFVFVGQQDDIGKGTYSLGDALYFTALNLPEQAWQLMPISVLIGALIGLGVLARGSELTIMRVSGWSVWRVARAAALGGLLFVALSVLVGEFMGPQFRDLADRHKTFAKFSDVSFADEGGVWVRDGNRIINISRQTADGVYGGVTVFEFTPERRLAAIGWAASARAARDGGWELSGYRETRLGAAQASAASAEVRRLGASLSPELLTMSGSDVRYLGIRQLLGLTAHLEANGLDDREAQFQLWSRIARTVAVLFAVLLAVPFVFGSFRAAGTGARTLIGLMLGIGFFLLQQMLSSGVIVFDVHPILLAWVPTGLMALAAGVLISTTR